jgi:hypothetical protein
VKSIAEEMDVGFLGLGFQPKWGVADTPVMPKGRYEIMRKYMPTVGSMGLDMMFRTTTIQVRTIWREPAAIPSVRFPYQSGAEESCVRCANLQGAHNGRSDGGDLAAAVAASLTHHHTWCQELRPPLCVLVRNPPCIFHWQSECSKMAERS